MADELEDKDSKTEDPSERKLEEAIGKGQVAYSREVTSFLMLLGLSIITIFILPFIANKIALEIRKFIEHAGDIDVTAPTISTIFFEVWNRVILFSLPIFLFIIMIIVFSSFIQHGQFIFAPDQIMPKFSRISLTEGIKRLFSFKSLAEFLKGILKVSVSALIIYFVIMDDIKILPLYSSMSTASIVTELYKIVKDILISVTIFMFVIGTADFFYQKYEYFKNLMMSRQEMKEEYKQSEGSPEVKQRQRRLMNQASKKRMMANVPKADVIITNPEHYSVALEYKYGSMDTPIVIAKGADLIALKIREVAKENDIPIVENVPLARALYLVDIDSPIPVEHYKAVAEIISYIYKLKKRPIK